MIHGYTCDEGHGGHWGLQGVRVGDPRPSGVSASSGRVTRLIACVGASRVSYMLATEGWPTAKWDCFRAVSLLLRQIEGVTYLFYRSVHTETSSYQTDLALRFNTVLLPSRNTFFSYPCLLCVELRKASDSLS